MLFYWYIINWRHLDTIPRLSLLSSVLKQVRHIRAVFTKMCMIILCTLGVAGSNIGTVDSNFHLCGWLWSRNSPGLWRKLNVDKTLIWRPERRSFKHYLYPSEALSASAPEQSIQTQNSDCDEEKEIVLYKRHKKYFEEVQIATARVWRQTCQSKSQKFNRDMNLFMSRCSVNSEFVTNFNGCAAFLPCQKYRCLDCFDTDLCAGCYLSRKQRNSHLITHRMIDLR